MRFILLLMLLSSPALAQVNHDISHNITVSGENQLQIMPDIAYVNLTVYGKATTNVEAKKQADQLLREAKRVVASFEIAEKFIKSNYITINPVYEYTDNKQKLVGYEASYSLQITVEKLDNVGGLLERLVQAGIDRINNVQYALKNDEAARLIAMQKAVANAKLKAQALADAAGVKLGKPIYISENGGSNGAPTPVYAMRAEAMMMDKSAGGEQLPMGELNISSNVNVIFEIE